MKTRLIASIFASVLIAAAPAFAMEGMAGHGTTGKGTDGTGHQAPKGFTHQEDSQGVQAEFQIMRLADMNMNDPNASHHVMLKLVDSATREQIKQVEGKIKIVAPDNSEQVSDLKNYSGTLAANVNFAAPGKYGVICLFRAQGQKHLIKFWYPHQS